MSENLKIQIRGLSGLLNIAQQVRKAADSLEFSFITVNETYNIVPYRQAILWRTTKGDKGVIEAVSGLAVVEKNAPFTHWLTKVLSIKHSQTVNTLTADDIPEELGEEWHNWLPENGILLPLITADEKLMGILFLVRDEPWQDYEITILQQLIEVYSYTWSVILGRKWYNGDSTWVRKLSISVIAAIIIVVLFFVPVHLSALAPGEVVPLNPTFIRSPIAGVVDNFLVIPNQVVKKNQPLFQLDSTTLRNRLKISKKSLAVADAKFLLASKKAFFKKEENAELAILKELQAEKKAEVQYIQDLLEKIIVKADQDGIVIFTDVTDWLGRPVAMGEKIMVLAKPDKVELKINLPVADAIDLSPGTKVLFFLNIAPDNKQKAELSYASFQAKPTPAGILAYHLKARFIAGSTSRIGLRGTAKIYGAKTNIFYLIMRRPLAAIRQKLGL